MIEKHLYKWTLSRDFTKVVPLNFGEQRKDYKDERGNIWLSTYRNFIWVHARYSWDGCSPKYKILGKILGTWDGPSYTHRLAYQDGTGGVEEGQSLKYASLVHDVLCQFHDQLPLNIDQEAIDRLFYKDCKAVGFKLSWVYYQAVRLNMKYINKRG